MFVILFKQGGGGSLTTTKKIKAMKKKTECQIIRKEIANYLADINRMSNNGNVYQLSKKWQIDPYTHTPTIEIEVKGTHVTRPFIEQLKSRVPSIIVEAICTDEGKLFIILSFISGKEDEK